MTKAEQARLVAWRHRILQFAADGDRSVSRACRHFGISRKTFYKWKGRYGAHGAAGLCDRPRAPLRSPRATAADVVRKILSSSTRTASPTMCTCSTRSCASGRTTTLTIAHTGALGGQTPYERLLTKTRAEALPKS
jgi:transposase-like protein